MVLSKIDVFAQLMILPSNTCHSVGDIWHPLLSYALTYVKHKQMSLPVLEWLTFITNLELGRIVRKPVNANPGLKVNRGNNFRCIKVLSIAYVLCSLRLLMLKTEGQKI